MLDGWPGPPAFSCLEERRCPFPPSLTAPLNGRPGLIRHGGKASDQARGKLAGACLGVEHGHSDQGSWASMFEVHFAILANTYL